MGSGPPAGGIYHILFFFFLYTALEEGLGLGYDTDKKRGL
jgi:hypothetical protein